MTKKRLIIQSISIVICFLYTLLWQSNLMAQEKWTVEQCISYGIEKNLRLKSLDYEQASRSENYRQSIRDLLPEVNAGADYGINYGRSVNPNTNDIINTEFSSNNYSLNASMSLFNGFQNQNRIKTAQLLKKASQKDSDQEKYMLSLRIMDAYYQVVFLKKSLELAEEQFAIATNNFTLVQKQIELGLKAGAELYEAKAILATDELSLKQQQNALKLAMLKLKQEMNYDGTELELKDSDWSLQQLDMNQFELHSLYAESQQSFPLLQAQQLRVQAADKQLKVARSVYSPSLNAFASYGSGYFETNMNAESGKVIPFRQQLRDNAFTFVGISLNIPISSPWTNRSTVQLQKIELLQAKNQQKIAEQEVFQNIERLIEERTLLMATQEQINLQVETRAKVLEIAQKRYQKGMVNAIELSQAKVGYASAKNDAIQIEMKILINHSTLQLYKGVAL